MRSQVAKRLRTNSVALNAIPPAPNSTEYSTPLANLAARILYPSPLPSPRDIPVYILNSWGFPDAREIDYDALLPYVLARLPDDEQLIGGQEYEVVFFAGGGGGNEATPKTKLRPSWGWFLQAYQILTRATRKRLQKLYIVHEKSWIRVLVEAFATIVSPKFRKKVVHGEAPIPEQGEGLVLIVACMMIVACISSLALHMPIQDLLIPPSAYLSDRRKTPEIFVAGASGPRAFAVKEPLPISVDGSRRLPRVLREATSFLIMDENIKTQGIFRVNARAQTVEILREAYDRGQKFIVWREGQAVLASSYRKEGTGDVWVEELDLTEGYELMAAAALIKLWYKELRQPIFPTSSYQALEKFYSDPDISLDPPQLLAMLSMDDDWSPISSKMSRQIFTMHLLPLLSRVAEFSDWNQMTPANLAVCFAPSLLCGPDPLEDLKISGYVRRILIALITHWKKDLAPLLNTDYEKFENSLRMPELVEDREDPLEEIPMALDISGIEAQLSGITLVDNDESDAELEGSPPPLPPRHGPQTIERNPISGTNTPTRTPPNGLMSPVGAGQPNAVPQNGEGTTAPLRRKPAPAIQPLPRYSTIVTDRPAALQGLQYYNTVAPTDDAGEEEDHMHHPPPYVEGMPSQAGISEDPPLLPPRPFAAEPSTNEVSIQRKPLPKTAG